MGTRTKGDRKEGIEIVEYKYVEYTNTKYLNF